MALINCPECKTEVSTTAAACPKCGARIKPKSNILAWVIGAPVAVFALLMAVGASVKTDPEKDRARMAFELCMQDLKDPLRDPRTTDVVRGACQRMRADFAAKYGREP